MITIQEYFGQHKASPDITDDIRENARELLERVNALLDHLIMAGLPAHRNPKTGSQISGEKYGGFRPQSCTIGARRSAHKTGEAVDIYDPTGKIDQALLDAFPDLLEKIDLYMEHPTKTLGWCHLSTRPPKSGKRIFYP